MSTELTTECSTYRALAESGGVMDVIRENLGDGATLSRRDLTRVTIPTGGSTVWSWQTASGAQRSEQSLKGLFVVQGRTERSLWPNQDAGGGHPPLLVVHGDSKVAHRVGTEYGDLDRKTIEAAKLPDGTYDIEKLPQYFAWNDRKPPRAKASRVIAILRPDDFLPLLVQVSQTSVERIEQLVKGLALDGVPFYRAVVELTLEKRQGARAAYSVIVCRHRPDEMISEEMGRLVKERITDVFTPIVCPPIRPAVEAVEAEAVPF